MRRAFALGGALATVALGLPTVSALAAHAQTSAQAPAQARRPPTEWHQAHQIPYVNANLIALKDGMPRNGGPIRC